MRSLVLQCFGNEKIFNDRIGDVDARGRTALAVQLVALPHLSLVVACSTNPHEASPNDIVLQLRVSVSQTERTPALIRTLQ